MADPDRSLGVEGNLAVLQGILATAVDAVVTIDERGTILMANASTESMFGYQQHELVGANVTILMPERERSLHDGYIRRYIESGEAKIIGIGREVEARHRDGTLFPVELAVSEVNFKEQRLFTGVVRNISERRRTEQALQRERNFADDLIRTASAAIVVLDRSLKVRRINPYLEGLSGYRQDEALDRDWIITFVPKEEQARVQDVFHNLLKQSDNEVFVHSILCKNGRLRTIAWSCCHLTNSDEVIEGVLAIGNDVSELLDAERRLIQSERLAAIGEMMTGLAHESRNALQRCRACLDMLELDLEPGTEQVGFVQRAQNALEELQRLYEEVRGYAAPMKLEVAEHDICSLVREVWKHVESNQLQFRLVTENADRPCSCDRNRIGQVIRNILENAVAASPAKGTIEVVCDQMTLNGIPFVRLKFRDEGPGLNSEQRQHIFDPFYSTKPRGTGLGMAIALRIVEAHHGQIVIGNDWPKGAEIIVMLPYRDRQHSRA